MPKSEAAKLLSAGGALTALGGAYKLGELLYRAKRLRDVGPANAVYVRLINRVRADLDEVRRLLTVREVHDVLEANKEKATWVYGAMRDVRGALENITPHTERVSSDIDDGRRVGLRHRVYWLLSEKEKLENREKELSTAHASLNKVIGYLTALEPDEHPHRNKHEKKLDQGKHGHDEVHRHEHVDKPVNIDFDIRREGPDRVERDVWAERDDGGSRRIVEERETWVEHEHRGPRRVEEHYVAHEHRGPSHFDERETRVDNRGPPRYDEGEVYAERDRDLRMAAHHDQHLGDDRHIERGPRDPRHMEARYPQRGPVRFEEERYEERRFSEPLGRRPELYEDRVPDRDSWMQSEARRFGPSGRYGGRNDYAEYGAPQPVGAAHYRLPRNRDFEREVWIEEKEDFRYDEYGNRLPDRYFPSLNPRGRL